MTDKTKLLAEEPPNDNTYTDNELNQEDKDNELTNEEIKVVVLYEECIDKTSNQIESSISWVNASLFQSALHDTMFLWSLNETVNLWWDCIMSLILGIIIIFIPRYWEDISIMKMELNSNTTDSTDYETLKKSSKQSKKNKEDKIKQEIDFFKLRFEKLTINIISCVISMTVRDASRRSFENSYGKNITNVESAAYFLYAFCWTVVGVVLTLKLSKYLEKYQKHTMNKVDELHDKLRTHRYVEMADLSESRHRKGMSSSLIFDYEHIEMIKVKKKMKDTLTTFVLRKRGINLLITTVSFVMAWSWRIAIITFIIGMYDGDTSSEINAWIYVIIVTSLIAFYFSLMMHYYCMYPKKQSKQQFYQKSLTRIKISKLLNENCKYVAGFAWRDAIMVSFYVNAHETNIGINVLFYWIVTFGLMWISITLTHLFTKRKLVKKIEQIGVARWITTTVYKRERKNADNNIDDDDDEEFDENIDELTAICDTYLSKVIELIINSWNIAGSLFVTNAATYSIAAIYMNTADYDITTPNDSGGQGLFLEWIACGFTFGTTFIIMAYLKRIIMSIRKKRQLLTNKMINIRNARQYKPGNIENTVDLDFECKEINDPHGNDFILIDVKQIKTNQNS